MKKANKIFGLLGSQLKPQGIIRLWGRFRFLWTFVAVYVSILILIFSAITAYSTTIMPWLRDYFGYNLGLVTFIAVIILIIGIGLIVEHKITVPGAMAIHNEQIYKQDNPIVRDIREVKDDVAKLSKQLKTLGKELGKIKKVLEEMKES